MNLLTPLNVENILEEHLSSVSRFISYAAAAQRRNSSSVNRELFLGAWGRTHRPPNAGLAQFLPRVSRLTRDIMMSATT